MQSRRRLRHPNQPSQNRSFTMKSRSRLLGFFCIGVGVLIGLFYINPAPYLADPSAPQFSHAELKIQRSDKKTFSYHVEVASTTEQETYGLMFRHSMPADAGMIFIYDPARVVSMWMKNTYLPLDMLYIKRDGVIVKIVSHAQPFDLTPLSSEEPVLLAGTVSIIS
jgi:uncharacterized membrane protein (UPF0127 family)